MGNMGTSKCSCKRLDSYEKIFSLDIQMPLQIILLKVIHMFNDKNLILLIPDKNLSIRYPHRLNNTCLDPSESVQTHIESCQVFVYEQSAAFQFALPFHHFHFGSVRYKLYQNGSTLAQLFLSDTVNLVYLSNTELKI